MILHLIIAMVAGWINRHQQQVIAYQQEEIRVLTSKLPHGRLLCLPKIQMRVEPKWVGAECGAI